MPDIFQEAGLPLWLRPYEVLCTSSYTALIETIPDTVWFKIHAFHYLKIFIFLFTIILYYITKSISKYYLLKFIILVILITS